VAGGSTALTLVEFHLVYLEGQVDGFGSVVLDSGEGSLAAEAPRRQARRSRQIQHDPNPVSDTERRAPNSFPGDANKNIISTQILGNTFEIAPRFKWKDDPAVQFEWKPDAVPSISDSHVCPEPIFTHSTRLASLYLSDRRFSSFVVLSFPKSTRRIGIGAYHRVGIQCRSS